MNRLLHILSALVVPGLLAACAPATRVILLPEADGRATAVEVKSAGGVQRLSSAYQTAEVSQDGQLQLRTTDAQTVKERYGAVLAHLPAADEHFLLYFEPGSSLLTVESKDLLPAILMRAGQRSGGEIIVIGHTDRVGALEANDALSLLRARAIRELLVAQGFKPELVEAVGRGERDPLVPTEDEVDEPRNRRAEIVVR
jgi:outer membrane protein OmpA-like peptidoglycan-associated protein